MGVQSALQTGSPVASTFGLSLNVVREPYPATKAAWWIWNGPRTPRRPERTGGERENEAENRPEGGAWDAAQSILNINPRTRGNNTRAKIPFLLKGLVEGLDGRALTAAWTRKGAGKLYRYYVHTRENKEHAGASGLPRLPALELEASVIEQMRLVLRAPDLKTRVARLMTRSDKSIDEAQVCLAMLQIDKIWDQLFPVEQERIVRLLIRKVVVTPHNIEVQFRGHGMERLAAELKPLAAPESVEEMVA